MRVNFYEINRPNKVGLRDKEGGQTMKDQQAYAQVYSVSYEKLFHYKLSNSLVS